MSGETGGTLAPIGDENVTAKSGAAAHAHEKDTGILRRLYRGLPPAVRQLIAPLVHAIRSRLDPNMRARDLWLRDSYSRFGDSSRETIFLSIARFCHINRPIEGYYFEFGCHSGRTMKLAWKHTRHLFNWTYVGFDSFEGLPEIAPVDRQAIWAKGKLKTAEEDFVAVVTTAGMPDDRLMTVKGFYDDTLTPALTEKLLPRKAAAIYIDCDLYASTVPILKFIPPFLQPGTVIVFDDWNCFTADPERGERRAWREFQEEHPELNFVPFVATSEAQSFIFVGKKS